MDDNIPPENDQEPFSDDSDNAPEDEFPSPSDGEEFLDDFDMHDTSDIDQPQRQHHAPQAENHDMGMQTPQDYAAPMDLGNDEGMGFDDQGVSAQAGIEEVTMDQLDVSSVPIQIDLELTRVKVSLAELQRMQPGQKVPIDINPRMINLVVGGKLIGKGEIVHVGDAACVKVIELYK